jgi:hypothetical protein
MIFYTESGSAYELDISNTQIRRLGGKEDPTPRQGKDGEWKKYEFCSEVIVGLPVLIQWEGVRSTVTSYVTEAKLTPVTTGEAN